METESPAFIPTTFNPVSTAFISTPSPQPIARLYHPQPSRTFPKLAKPLPSPPRANHRSRNSVDSLYDLLADLDESQLTYLVQELNNTTSSNLAVGAAISAFETPTKNFSMPQRTMSKSQKVRLSLQTMFRAKQEPEVKRSPAYKRISRPNFDLPEGVTIVDLLDMLESEFRYHNSGLSPSSSSSQLGGSPGMGNSSILASSSSSFSTPSPSGRKSSRGSNHRVIRRYPSTLDMTLEAERSAMGVEGIGLSLLEPRPTTPASVRGSPVTPGWERSVTPQQAPPVMLEGIFEVLGHK